MKRVLVILIVAALAFGAGSWVVLKQLTLRHAAQMGEQQTAWQNERAELEAALAQARESSSVAPLSAPIAPVSVTVTNVSSRQDPKEILAKLQLVRPGPGAGSSASLRRAVHLLEELTECGAAALPAIQEFLAARHQDFDWDLNSFFNRGSRDRVPLDFVVAPSLRFGLFNVLRQIGGTDAEGVLAESLASASRGAEVAYLAQALQSLAQNKYRDQSLAVARTLLAAAPVNSNHPLDRNHRDYLFGVLSLFGDTGFTTEAQSQLVRTDNQIDRSALKYLEQTLGAQSVMIAAQAYQNPALTNADSKEPLARVALTFAGADPQANAFYAQAINDPTLTRSHRKNLIEDLNEAGFTDRKNLTERELPLIQNRLSLIEQLAPTPLDDANAAAFKEAYKDLVNMRERILRGPPAATAK